VRKLSAVHHVETEHAFGAEFLERRAAAALERNRDVGRDPI